MPTKLVCGESDESLADAVAQANGEIPRNAGILSMTHQVTAYSDGTRMGGTNALKYTVVVAVNER